MLHTARSHRAVAAAAIAAAALTLPGCPTDQQPAPPDEAEVTSPPPASPPAKPEAAEPATPAAPALSEREKIDWLIAQVESSDAVFIRNGVEAAPTAAAAHLRAKLRAAGDRVKTAREFIDQLASESSATGRPYLIRTPDGDTVESRVWFTTHLDALEAGAAGPAAPDPR